MAEILKENKMALYDRDYMQNNSQTQQKSYEQAQSQHQSSISAFIKQTYQLFAASLLAASAGAYIGIGMAATISSNFWLFFILEIALLVGLMFGKKIQGLNLVLLFAFTFVSGFTLGPILSHFIGMKGGSAIVANAFVLTTAAFGGLSVFAMNTKKDFTALGKMLFISLIVFLVASIIGIFFHSPVFHLLLSSVGAILFSAYILYDTQNIIRGNYETPIDSAIALYLDFLNLFIHLLQILGILGSDE